MSQHIPDDWISAWLDDELSDSERRQFEAALAEDAQLRERVESFQRLGNDLRRLPTHHLPASFAAALREQVESNGGLRVAEADSLLTDQSGLAVPAASQPTRRRTHLRYLAIAAVGSLAALLLVSISLLPLMTQLSNVAMSDSSETASMPAPAASRAEAAGMDRAEEEHERQMDTLEDAAAGAEGPAAMSNAMAGAIEAPEAFAADTRIDPRDYSSPSDANRGGRETLGRSNDGVDALNDNGPSMRQLRRMPAQATRGPVDPEMPRLDRMAEGSRGRSAFGPAGGEGGGMGGAGGTSMARSVPSRPESDSGRGAGPESIANLGVAGPAVGGGGRPAAETNDSEIVPATTAPGGRSDGGLAGLGGVPNAGNSNPPGAGVPGGGLRGSGNTALPGMPTEGVAALNDAGQNAETSNEFERSINAIELGTRGLSEAEVGETAEFVGATWVAVLPSKLRRVRFELMTGSPSVVWVRKFRFVSSAYR